jgi:Tol biopolymer transport system component
MKRLIALATSMMVTMGLLAAAGSARAAPAPSTNGQILFSRYDPTIDDDHLFTANPDGSHEVRLPPLSAGGECGSWSPDGSKVLENTPNAEGVPRPATVNPDGSGFKLLDNPDAGLFLGCGNWSPDMARISSEGFGVVDPGRNGIYTMRSSNGRGLFRVTTNPGGDDNPWGYSPDGSKILFSRIVPGCLGAACDNGDLFVVNVDGTGLQQLNPPSIRVSCCNADWSPDGARVVFAAIFKTSTGSGSQSALFVVNVDGTGLHQLTPDGMGARHPDWSPDGHLIAFNNEAKESGLQIYVVHPDGNGLKRVTDPTNGDFSFEPVWSPDSTKLLFSRVHVTNGSGQEDLWIANADGTGLIQVTNTPNPFDFEEAVGWSTHPLAS